MNEKVRVVFLAVSVCVILLVVGGIFIYSRLRHNRPTGSGEQLSVELNQQLTDEQLRAVATVERIRGLTETATANLRELSFSTGRQGELLKELREKLKVLEDYYSGISGELNSLDNNIGN